MKPCAALLSIALACAWSAPVRAITLPSTFSIVAYDSVTQELGVAVQSKYFNVGSVVPWAEAGVGAVATQAQVKASYGPLALALLRGGMAPDAILKKFAAGDTAWSYRQLGIADAHGRVVSWTGPKCNDWAGGTTGAGFACQGNILAGPAVVSGMAQAFREAQGELGDRLMAALEAAQAAGGDKRGQQSAALLIVRPSKRHPEYAQRYVQLKVEDHATPIAELRRLWRVDQGFHGAAAHMELAAEYEEAGHREAARREREQVHQILVAALARGEKDASMLNGLAWSCATHDLELADAARAAERAAELEPKSTDILDTLAEVYFRMGRADQAVEVESRAAALDPKSQYLRDQIARFKAGAATVKR